jgi:hypothetical protein
VWRRDNNIETQAVNPPKRVNRASRPATVAFPKGNSATRFVVMQTGRVLLKELPCKPADRVHPEGISLDPEIFGIEGHPEGHLA